MARIKHDNIKLVAYIMFVQQFWTEKKEKDKTL